MRTLTPKSRAPRIRILLGGHSLIASTIAVGVVAAHAGSGQLHAFAALLLAFQAVAGFRSHFGLRRLSVSIDVPARTSVDATPSVRVRLENRKRLVAATSLELEWVVADAATMTVAPAWIDRVAARRVVEVELPVRPARRGVGTLVELRVSSAYPAHLFRRTLRFAIDAELLIAPKIVAVADPTGSPSALVADRRRHEGVAGEEFRGVRPWREGDSPRSIHHRTSARRGEPVARENESAGRPPFTLIVDPRGLAPEGVEAVLRTSASLVRRAVRERRRCSFRLAGRANVIEVRDVRSMNEALDGVARYVETTSPAPAAATVGLVVRPNATDPSVSARGAAAGPVSATAARSRPTQRAS